jgi:ubiquinone/menaquinone biosynthesis C-methylase UbiE
MKKRLYDLLRQIRDLEEPGLRSWVAVQAASIAEGSNVLDVGAGVCPYRSFFEHCRYIAYDFCANPVKTYTGVDIVGDIISMPISDAQFDVVLCTQVLEHVYDPVVALKEMARVMKIGGTLILTVPQASGIHEPPYHYYGGFTPYWLEKSLLSAGFSDISIERNGGTARYLAHELLMFPSSVKKHFSNNDVVGSLAALLILLCVIPVALIFGIWDHGYIGERKTLNFMVVARKTRAILNF